MDYFLNISSSRLDWMHSQHRWLRKYETVNITQKRNLQIKFQVWNLQTCSRRKISFKKHQSCLLYSLLVQVLPTLTGTIEATLWVLSAIIVKHNNANSLLIKNLNFSLPLNNHRRCYQAQHCLDDINNSAYVSFLHVTLIE